MPVNQRPRLCTGRFCLCAHGLALNGSYRYSLTSAATEPRDHEGRDENGTTPQPPAVFVLKNYFNFLFLQTIPPARAAAGLLQKNRN
jgi:hypothetical protein